MPVLLCIRVMGFLLLCVAMMFVWIASSFNMDKTYRGPLKGLYNYFKNIGKGRTHICRVLKRCMIASKWRGGKAAASFRNKG